MYILTGTYVKWEETTEELSLRKLKVKCKTGRGNTMCFLIGEQGFQAHTRAFAHSDSKCAVKCTAVKTTLPQQRTSQPEIKEIE